MQTCSFNTRGSVLGTASAFRWNSFTRKPRAALARARARLPAFSSAFVHLRTNRCTGTVMRLTRFARLKLFSSLSRDTALSETRASFARNYFRIRGSYRVTRGRISSFVTSRPRGIYGRNSPRGLLDGLSLRISPRRSETDRDA